MSILVCSIVSFALFWWDKRAAGKQSRRISERTLHLWALAGGWPGAMFARDKFRHKTKKQPFGMLLWGTVAGNLLIWLAIFWLLS